jgi:EPS-associated MarR family transcriptional regulator
MKKTNLKEDIHFRILHIIEENPEISQRDLSKKLGISLGRINFIIKALVEIGHIKLKNFEKNPNKLRYIYLLTPKGVSEKTNLTSHFLKRKINEFELLKKEIQSLGGKL